MFGSRVGADGFSEGLRESGLVVRESVSWESCEAPVSRRRVSSALTRRWRWSSLVWARVESVCMAALIQSA